MLGFKSACSTFDSRCCDARHAPVHAGVHWWYHTPSHAAELTAGYYNTNNRNGYNELLELCTVYGADAVLTCVEMTDAQHPPHAACGPQALLNQVRQAAHTYGLSIAGVHACCELCPGLVPNPSILSAPNRKNALSVRIGITCC
jgi:hypothetical protein